MSRTDADASIATSPCNGRLESSYKQHTAVDDAICVVHAVEVTGAVSGRKIIKAPAEAVREIAGRELATVTADADHSYTKPHGGQKRRGIDPLIPARKDPSGSRVLLRRFHHDAKNDLCSRRGVAPHTLRPRTGLFNSRTIGQLRTDFQLPGGGSCPVPAASTRQIGLHMQLPHPGAESEHCERPADAPTTYHVPTDGLCRSVRHTEGESTIIPTDFLCTLLGGMKTMHYHAYETDR